MPSWAQEDDPWSAAGAEQWDVPVEDTWPVIAQPEPEADVWNGGPDNELQHHEPFAASEGVDEWPVIQQPAEAAWAEEADTWNVQQPAFEDDWAATNDDPWATQPTADTEAFDADEVSYGDPYETQQVGTAQSQDGEQPWWAEQSGFGGQFTDQAESNLPYFDEHFDELDVEDTEDPYRYEEPAYGGVSNLFDADVDLDEPDPFELPDDDWSLPDEQPRSTRVRSQDREPSRGRGDRRPAKSQQRPGAKPKSTTARKKSSNKNANPLAGFRLPFGSGSTAVTVVVIAVAIVALSLLFKDAFQRVGAAPNPDGSTTVASCADAPDTTNSKKVDLAAAMLSTVDGAAVVADHQAGTGTIDFSRALAAEPDATTALSNLDQSRFERGYDRAFTVGKNGRVHVSVYEFKGSLCSAEYLKLHPLTGQTFTASDVQGSVGQVTQVGTKAFNGTIEGSIGDMVVLAQYTNATSADVAKATLQKILGQQITNLRTAGVQ